MPVEVVSYLLSNENIDKRLQFQLILQCAPFLKGIKVACVVSLDKESCRRLSYVLADTGVVYRVLGAGRGKYLVFLYRKEEFASYLEKDEVKGFLKVYGYETDDLNEVLKLLSCRIGQYTRKDEGFPHEIGAFLDYPIDDVRCFIEKEGRDYLAVGYWKVYHDLGRAQMVFLAYDRAKTRAVNEFLGGRSMQEICA